MTRPGVHHVNRQRSGSPIGRSPQGFAVHRHHVAATVGYLAHIARKPALKLFPIQQGQHPREGVVARRTVIEQLQLAQPVQIRLPEFRHVRSGFAARQQRGKGREQNLVQRILLRIAGARMSKAAKYVVPSIAFSFANQVLNG